MNEVDKNFAKIVSKTKNIVHAVQDANVSHKILNNAKKIESFIDVDKISSARNETITMSSANEDVDNKKQNDNSGLADDVTIEAVEVSGREAQQSSQRTGAKSKRALKRQLTKQDDDIFKSSVMKQLKLLNHK